MSDGEIITIGVSVYKKLSEVETDGREEANPPYH